MWSKTVEESSVHDNEAVLQAQIDTGEQRCEWFALCDNTATHIEPHPILKYVPTCDKCGDFIAACNE